MLASMKMRYLIAGMLCAAPVFADSDLPAPASEQAAEATELNKCLDDYTRAVVSICTLVETINSPADAKAVLPKIRTRMRMMQHQAYGISLIDEDKLEQAMLAANITPQRMQAINDKLLHNRFYGLAELAELFGYPATAVLEPGEATPELLQAIGQEITAALHGKLPADITGGPGLTEQTAWKLGTNGENLDHIVTIMETLPEAERVDQKRIHTEEGPIYGRITFTLPREGKFYELQMWFDITAMIQATEAAEQAAPHTPTPDNSEAITAAEEAMQTEPDMPLPEPAHVYTDAEKTAAMQQVVQLIKQYEPIFAGIQDQASATAAAPAMADFLSKNKAINAVIAQVSEMDLLELLEQHNIDISTIQDHFDRIIGENFYNSPELKKAFYQENDEF